MSEIAFDLARILFPSQAESARNPSAVRIHNYAREVKSMTPNHIGGLAPDTSQICKFRHG